jgi:hypothetical protein
MAARDVPPQNRGQMLPLFKPTETLFATRYREILHADLRRCSTPLVVPEAAVTPAIFEAGDVVAGVEFGGTIVETEGETVIPLTSGIEEMLHIGMTVVASVNAPTGAIAIGIALGHQSGGIFETRETRVMVLSV